MLHARVHPSCASVDKSAEELRSYKQYSVGKCTMEWTQESTINFIEIYEKYDVLWDAKHPQHYNKTIKTDSWEEIGKMMNRTAEECKRKMSSLLSALRREKMKMKKSRGTGTGRDDVYESSWFAFKSLMFLWDKDAVRKTKSTISDEEDTEANEESVSENVEETTNKEVSSNEDVYAAQEGYLPPEHSQAHVLTVQAQKAHSRKASSPLLTPKRKKKDIYDERLDEAFRILSNASTVPSNVSAKVQNEWQIFGDLVSTKIRKYSPQVQNIVEQEIMNILFKADRGHYNAPSTSSFISPQSYPQPYMQSYPTHTQTQSSSYKISSQHIYQPPAYHQFTQLHTAQYAQVPSPRYTSTPSPSPSPHCTSVPSPALTDSNTSLPDQPSFSSLPCDSLGTTEPELSLNVPLTDMPKLDC